MQPESKPQQYTSAPTEPFSPPKIRSNSKRVLLFVLVAIVAAALSGVAVWVYMSNQNDNNGKSLNAQIVTKNNKITSLQSNIKSLETQVATKTTTSTNSSQQTGGGTGLYESLVSFCGTNNKTVGSATLSDSTTNGEKGKYFGSCSVLPAGAMTGGYTLTAMYASGTWQELFGGQASTTASDATCAKYHIPTQLGTCSLNN